MTAAYRAALDLDRRLFNPASWFLIDAQQTYLHSVPSLEVGLSLVGKQRVAAVVGRLRRGMVVVDVDRSGPLGEFITFEIAGWLKSRGLWTLVRPSGGAKGRHHVFAHVGAREQHLAALEAYAAGLADELGVARALVDVRTAVRPLSSPHRAGGNPAPYGDVVVAERSLRRLFPTDPKPAWKKQKKLRVAPPNTPASAAGPGTVVPLLPSAHGRPMRAAWRRYLATGEPPALNGLEEYKRSLVEKNLTLELVWNGYGPDTAWQIIREAHPSAMTKSRERGRAWWLKVWWNQAVADAESFLPDMRAGRGASAPSYAATADAGVVAAVAAARERLERLARTQPLRSRPALLLVGHHVLDRIARDEDREEQLRVPCPERNLLVDTGITDRKTIRAALRLMDGVVGVLHKDSWDPAKRDKTSYEFEIQRVPVTGMREIPPPVSHAPKAPPGLWAILPRGCHSLWRRLLAGTQPLTVEELAVRAGLVDPGPDGEVPASQLRTTKSRLLTLGQAGLASVDADGRWAVDDEPLPHDLAVQASEEHLRLSQMVEAERAEYRAPAQRWEAGRAAAWKKQLAKQKAWWENLPTDVRRERLAELRSEFDGMVVAEQARLKARLAERRAKAGIVEAEHHAAWLSSLTPDELAERSHTRRRWFARLSTEEKGLRIDAWARHRARYDIPDHHSPTPEPAATGSPSYDERDLVPDGTAERDAAFLCRQVDRPLPGLEEPAAS